MDANISCIAKSDELFEAGKYRDSLATLLGLVDMHLSPQQKAAIWRRIVKTKCRLLEFKLAVPDAKKYVELEKQVSGVKSKNYAVALNDLAMCQVADNNNKARQNIQKAISIMKKLKLEETEHYGSAIHTLGRVYLSEDMDAEALSNFTMARTILSKFKESRDYLVATTSLGICHGKRGEHEKALEYFKESFELELKRVGNKHPHYASAALQLASCYVSLKRRSESLSLLEEVLIIYRNAFGENHVYTTDLKKTIAKARKEDKPLVVKEDDLLKYMKEDGGCTEEEIGQLKTICKTLRTKKSTLDCSKVIGAVEETRAELTFRDAEGREPEERVEILSKLLEKTYCDALTKPDRVKLFGLLCDAHSELKDYNAALIYANLSVKAVRDLEGDKSKNYVAVMEILARCYLDSGNLEAAARIAQEATEVFPQDLEQQATLLHLLGSIEEKRKNFEKALEFYHQARHDTSLESDRLLYTGLTAGIDVCYRKSNRWDLAYDVRKKHLVEVGKLYGEESIEYADSLCCLAAVLVELKQYELSCVALQKALSIQKQEATQDKDIIARIEKDLAIIYQKTLIVHREDIDVGHMFRFCNQCERVAEGIEICNGCCRVWYCSQECQLKHWPTHKSLCTVCFNCDKPLDRDAATFLRCSKCKNTKYCSLECQKEDWKEHKKTCNK